MVLFKARNQYIYGALLSFFVWLSCSTLPNENNKTVSAEYQEVRETKIKFNFKQSFEIKEIRKSSSMATIHVRGVGFQNSNNTIFLNDVEPFESALIADIDSNGFEELYIITRSVGSGSFAKIYGIATMDGSSYKLIFNPENDKKVNYNFDYLDQYRGHDSIYIENKQLRRSFPLFNENDKKCCPTEGKRILTYKLVTYENALTLHVYKVQ